MQRLVQLALDLFGGPPPGEAQPPRQGGSPSNPVSAGDLIAGDAIEKVAKGDRKQGPVGIAPPARAKPAPSPSPTTSSPSAPAAPLGTLLSPAILRHPRASREVLLGDALVAYALQRARRRTIGFTVGADGLSVRAPGWVTLAAVDAALQEKSAWILRKLGEAQARQQRVEGTRIAWGDGAVLPYLGEPLTVVLDPTHGFRGAGGALVEGPEGQRQLHVGLPHTASPAQVRDAVQAWLMRDARQRFIARLDHFAPLLGVRWSSLRLSSAQTRWGSARSDGSIRLNWRLLHYRPAIIDYVVAHELSHLRVMDHSPRFWDTVRTVVPDYADLRGRLRDEPAPPWD
ncbi:SprT family zinc-dependent metalloprotease [Acidovorax sp. SUPP3334]|uniref:M48 family metallopeptidase n=1 Tax=Acidovorax sp. SUPP3334 TaxID=2920881 RepID=UPI0023DE4632|nr:SprT family zinc-dependent metalloprotease [Acidovorax sp. SUPP3334]GKT22000.1 M48 family metallopeptidase [Acidovorax sp. SUPP3334]